MEILHFLAIPLCEEDVSKLVHYCKASAFDAEKYLIPIRYKQVRYLAKPVEKFPISIETWELHVRHVRSLLKCRFGFLLQRDLIFLACEAGLVIKESVF